MSSTAKPSVYGALTAALWSGAAWLFAFSVAPSAFDVLPHGLAGTLVGRVLPPLLVVGMFFGFGIAIVDISVRRWAGVIMGAACGIDRYGVIPRVGDPGTPTFGRLHAVSVVLYGIASLAALVVVIAAWRSYGTQYSRG